MPITIKSPPMVLFPKQASLSDEEMNYCHTINQVIKGLASYDNESKHYKGSYEIIHLLEIPGMIIRYVDNFYGNDKYVVKIHENCCFNLDNIPDCAFDGQWIIVYYYQDKSDKETLSFHIPGSWSNQFIELGNYI